MEPVVSASVALHLEAECGNIERFGTSPKEARRCRPTSSS